MANLNSILERLRLWRENNDRKSRKIVEYWITELESNIQKLGREKALILEQVCIAALDCNEFTIAKKCLKELHKDFPNSLRVRKYEAMLFEAQEKYEDAIKILDDIIKVDETNSGAKKRKIAILKAQGKTVEAIKELADYLKIFMADGEAWQELSELYITEQDFQKAAFCVEELILHNPHNHLLHQRYADIKYTQGGLENIELARSYYCQAIKLNPKNVRALYGLYIATTAIATSAKCSSQKKKEAQKLSEWALNEIQNQYKHSNIDDIEDRLGALQIN
ncbi:ER membrane protein complex subunit 2 [Tribolium castaneum]|uniref:ER membrane protein complex subunit 2 n=1 Tax=Tribolium castaneum TaxID=7070 RepID=D6WAQ9_TRICA|nr:PREDICTED: ER membrane protein complex subunit 2 [Tribolium castaneum]EEZ98669.1 ER membrane protein complex subunit 2-like Protein [Tribolium castaneum]|eukprot:XP_966972.1 PREDICTED: ER membrane protein complex subunit 2 [Tribolium castaneum]